MREKRLIYNYSQKIRQFVDLLDLNNSNLFAHLFFFNKYCKIIVQNIIKSKIMQVLVNKKNQNRIFRRPIRSLDHKDNQFSAQPSTKVFQTLKQLQRNNINLLQQQKDQNTRQSKLKFIDSTAKLNQLTRFKVPKRFSQLARPKPKSSSLHNFNGFSQNICLRQRSRQLSIQNKKLYHTSRTINNNANRQNNQEKINKLQKMNNTISFFDKRNSFQRNPFNQTSSKKRHSSLYNAKNSEYNILIEPDKNTIHSNKLGTLSTQQILRIKNQQQRKKQLFKNILKGGVMLSNEAAQTDQFREMCLLLFPQKSNIKHNQNLESPQSFNDILDKNAIQKYKKLLETINYSQQKYDVAPYEQYNQILLQKNVASMGNNAARLRKKKKTYLYNAEQWR